MTRSMQTKVIEKLTMSLSNVNESIEVVNQPNYANTGHLYVQVGFKTFLDVAYDFQSDRCRIIASGPAIDDAAELADNPPQWRVEDRGRGRELAWHALPYTDGDRLTRMVMTLRAALTEAYQAWEESE